MRELTGEGRRRAGATADAKSRDVARGDARLSQVLRWKPQSPAQFGAWRNAGNAGKFGWFGGEFVRVQFYLPGR
jgi:hypothetical protein